MRRRNEKKPLRTEGGDIEVGGEERKGGSELPGGASRPPWRAIFFAVIGRS
jgi:hypothetical protein